MEELEDRLFERWCRQGDTQALGELFDAAAPRLLKLAIHLAGDVADAEDLVQATFLAAIEQRASVDPSRPVMPWLSGVLANKARARKRDATRSIDPERLVARAAADAAEPLERRELDGAVAQAIDRLGEPYRQVLVLRLRHGLEIGDIAHVLERDSGTVRVQLHRGLEKLRALLPAALASSLLLGLVTSRGLAAVRAQVLNEAAAALATSTLTLGGLLVTKQIVFAAAVVVAIVALVLLQRAAQDAAGPRDDAGVRAQATSESGEDRALQAAAAPADSPPVDATARTAVEAPRAAEHVLRGVVVDAESRLPIGGATLRLFEPREAYAVELVRAHPDLYEIELHGRLRALTRADWPLVVARSAAARAGREELLVYDRPPEDEAPLAETTSGGDGTFGLGCGPRGGVIECSSAGRATRWRPVRDFDGRTTIALWRECEVRGVVLGPDGQPASEPLQLVFTAVADPTENGSKWSPGDADELREAIGAFATRTGGDGRFALKAGASRASVAITTPGWSTSLPITVELDAGELTIHAVRTPVFRFFDASTRAPIERVRLLGRDQRDQYVRWSGEYVAPGGVLTLPGAAYYLRSHDESTLTFVAWSEGYAPASVSITRISSAGTIEVPLEAGAASALDGVVRRDGDPLAGVEVALIGQSPLQWSIDEDWIVDAATADSDGRFHLAAPAGSYVLRVRVDDRPFFEFRSVPDMPGSWVQRALAGREPYFQRVDLPAAEPLDIDLARSARIEVEITDTLGAPQVDHVLALRSDDGRQSMEYTDQDGRARFANLPRGKYRLHTPHVNTRGSFAGGELREIELEPGENEFVHLELPAPTGPRHARVAARDVADFTGWRARYDVDPWQQLGADGSVPMDLTTDAFTLEVHSPAGRRWHVPIPKDAPDGHVIELDAGAQAYRGELLRADGGPWPGVAVYASVSGPCSSPAEARTSCITDEHGVFELQGLADCPYVLQFQTETGRTLWDDGNNGLAGVRFAPARLPSDAPEWLTIRVADPTDLVRVRGVVKRASGERMANTQLVFECTVALGAGQLSIGGTRSFTHTDEHGAFDVELPRTPELTVSVYTQWSAEGLALKQRVSATDTTLELSVP